MCAEAISPSIGHDGYLVTHHLVGLKTSTMKWPKTTVARLRASGLVTSVASSRVVGKCLIGTTLLHASPEVYGKQD